MCVNEDIAITFVVGGDTLGKCVIILWMQLFAIRFDDDVSKINVNVTHKTLMQTVYS